MEQKKKKNYAQCLLQLESQQGSSLDKAKRFCEKNAHKQAANINWLGSQEEVSDEYIE